MVKRFISDHVIKAGPTKQREALQRFMVLWQTRYHVWPRMEERAQKKFHMYTENDKDDSQVGVANTLDFTMCKCISVRLPCLL